MKDDNHLPMIPEEDEDEKNLLKKSTNTNKSHNSVNEEIDLSKDSQRSSS